MTLEKDTISKAGFCTNRAAARNCHPRTDVPRQAEFAFSGNCRRIQWPKPRLPRLRRRKQFIRHEQEALWHMAQNGDECAQADLFRLGYISEASPTPYEAP